MSSSGEESPAKQHPFVSRILDGGQMIRCGASLDGRPIQAVDIEVDQPLVPMFLLGEAPASRPSDGLQFVQSGAVSMIESRKTIKSSPNEAITLPRLPSPIRWRERCAVWHKEIDFDSVSPEPSTAGRCEPSIYRVNAEVQLTTSVMAAEELSPTVVDTRNR